MLVCLQNNGESGESETTANLMGPFWREGSPPEKNGASIVRSPTAGDPIFITGTVVDLEGNPVPVEGARVDVWNTSGEGIYENQDPRQAEHSITSGSSCGRARCRCRSPQHRSVVRTQLELFFMET